jgi:hypothetical protein
MWSVIISILSSFLVSLGTWKFLIKRVQKSDHTVDSEIIVRQLLVQNRMLEDRIYVLEERTKKLEKT